MEKLREQYEKEVVPALMKKFNYKSIMEVPKLEKIVLNVGLGDIRENPKALENTMNDLSIITGQKPVVTKAKKSIAAFKIREGVNMGCKVTLRSTKMYEFAYKLFNVALPRVRDFRGVSSNSFDGRGNYSMGIKEQLIFPEIEYDKVDKLRAGVPIGCKVTLRQGKMYDFAEKLFNVALPRVRDFRGVPANSFDGRGNYSMGIKEQVIFPEIEYEKVDKVRGMDIIFVTTANTDEEAKELLKLLGMPFKA